ncbi:MAG: aspartate carbamoyltransferase [Actinomycetota bacterium]|jgi:aspartate carbamoyltransferase catalytic subunit
MKHLITTAGLDAAAIGNLLDVADHMAEINSRPVPKVPALRGRTVASVFFEDSTRTRLSFETAAKRLSADTMTFSASTSSLNKGESLRDTIETLSAMGVDAFVVRHKSSGVPEAVTQWTDAVVINAGDGWHQHPTQALLDAFTVTRSFGDGNTMQGRHIAIVGDIKHSRVARSCMDVFVKLGARVTAVAPSTLLPAGGLPGGVAVAHGIDDVVGECDVLYMLRMQRERMDSALVPELGEYSARFGLDPARAARLPAHTLVMHPGPMNRGVEMLVDPSHLPGSRILAQVANGVSVRMAVLFSLLGGAAAGLERGDS